MKFFKKWSNWPRDNSEIERTLIEWHYKIPEDLDQFQPKRQDDEDQLFRFFYSDNSVKISG